VTNEDAMVEQYEEFPAGHGRRVVVARRAAHWFVLEISAKGSEVHGPVLDWAGLSTHEQAVHAALAMHAQASESGRAVS
jgi:hypothetical protein